MILLVAGAAALVLLISIAVWLVRRRSRLPTGHLVLTPASFIDLPGWHDDPVSQTLPALQLSCRRMTSLPDAEPLGRPGSSGFAGTAGDWRSACAAAARVPPADDTAPPGLFRNA